MWLKEEELHNLTEHHLGDMLLHDCIHKVWGRCAYRGVGYGNQLYWGVYGCGGGWPDGAAVAH